MLAGYRIETLLGRGGMGVVYLARDPWLDRSVALKLIKPELAEDQRFRERFLRESRLAASLEHANVIPIYEAGEADGALYLSMRFVEGGDLRSLLTDDGRLEPSRALALLERVAVALDAAHARGLVHRDVTPGNVLIASAGDVYLSDFGLTRGREESDEPAEAAEFEGTLDYMAPEQLRQLDVSPATDVYALACVLFECLTGEVPFRSRRALALMFAHAEADRPPASERAPELPVAIDAVIARGMAQSPGARYASCGELVTEAWLALGSERAGESAERASGARRALPATEARNPYKGLRAFGEADAEDFHGREALSDELLERLGGRDRGRLVVVVGPSGSGKSSVVRAGVLPLVRRGAVPGSERWLIAELVPGALPVEELEAALLRLSFTR